MLRFPQRPLLARARAIGDHPRMTALPASSLTKIAEGRAAEIFAWDAGTVLKLYRTGGSACGRDIELAATVAVHAAGGPVPAARGAADVDGRPGLLLERIEGIDMLTEIGKKPWTVFRAGTAMGRAHAALHTTEAPASIERTKDRLRRSIEQVRGHDAALGERGLRALEALPDGDRLCHGDFHPGNMILAPRGPMVIDWTNATSGDPASDVARTLLMLRLAELPPGSPLVIRALARLGRSILRSRYIAAYQHIRRIDMPAVERWTVPVAIARLTEGIEEERPRILALLGVA